jgi:hypothetical protein
MMAAMTRRFCSAYYTETGICLLRQSSWADTMKQTNHSSLKYAFSTPLPRARQVVCAPAMIVQSSIPRAQFL